MDTLHLNQYFTFKCDSLRESIKHDFIYIMRNTRVNMKKQKNGTYKVWWDEYDHLSKRHQRSKICKDRIEGERVRREALDRLLQGIPTKNNITVNQYLVEWLENFVEGKKTSNTEYSYNVNLNKHVMPRLGRIKLRDLRPLHIQSCINELLKEGKSNNTVCTIMAALRCGLNQAVREEVIQINPMDKIKMPKRTFKADIFDPFDDSQELSLSPSQVQRLFEHFDGTPLFIPVVLSVCLGLRRGEIAALTWGDVDFDRSMIRINKARKRHIKIGIVTGEPKTASSKRFFVAPGIVIHILREEKQNQRTKRMRASKPYNQSEWIWCNDQGEQYSLEYMSRYFRKHYDKLDRMPSITFHDLRKTNGTLMTQAGVPDKVRSARLGHATTQITNQTYTHVLYEMDKDAAKKLNTLINIPK